MAKAASETPLMQQHRAIKQKYPGAVLLFRVGDFTKHLVKMPLLPQKYWASHLPKEITVPLQKMSWLVFHTMRLIRIYTNWLRPGTALRCVIN
jgi:hypothetical protein